MTRGADKRKRKYEARIDGDVLKKQTESLKPLMVESETEYFADMSKLENKVKALVEAEGVTTLQVRDYLNYARELYATSRKFSGATANLEAQLKLNKWSDRGLDSTLLTKIAYLMGLEPSPKVTQTLPREGEIIHINETFTGSGSETVYTPNTDKKAEVIGFFLENTEDVEVILRFKTSQNVICALPTKGVCGMNLICLHALEGDENEEVEVYASDATSVKGWICVKES